jgi:hypothetical protein
LLTYFAQAKYPLQFGLLFPNHNRTNAMTLEATLERIAVALETIAKTGGTIAQATAQLGAPDAAAPTPAPVAGKGKKGNEKVTEAAANAAATVAAPAASAPPPAAAPAASSDAAPAWEAVLPQIQALNKGTADGQGRDGVMALLRHFGLDPDKGQTVPALKPLGKNSEILAFIKARMEPAAAPAQAAELDLGL